MEKPRYLSYLIKLLADRQETVFTQHAGPIPVTAPQGRLLMYLESRNGAPVSQRELEHYLGVSHTTVKGLLQRLEEKDLVRTAFDSADGRVKHAYLTARHSKMGKEIAKLVADFEERLLAGLSAEERETLRGLLERIYTNLLP